MRYFECDSLSDENMKLKTIQTGEESEKKINISLRKVK